MHAASVLTVPFLAILLSTPQLASAQVLLKFKFPDGATATVVTETVSNQTLTFGGVELTTESRQKRTVETTNGRRAPDGTIRVEQVFKALDAQLSLPGGIELQFDSADPDAPGTGTDADILLDILRTTAKSKWTMIHGPDDQVTAVEGGKQALESLDEKAQELVEKQFDPEYLKSQANTQLRLFPPTPVSKGETWRRSSDLRLEAGQHLSFTTDYQYVGTVRSAAGKDLEQIAVKVADVSYTIDEDSPAPLRISESDLKVAGSEGMILFDREAGHVVEHKDKVHIIGEITFVTAGQKVPGKLVLKMENTITRN